MSSTSGSDSPQGIYTLTVPTGGGKTLSSLRFALHHAKKHELERIFFIIPYTSIIEQNARVVRDMLENGEEPGTVVLEHHSNLEPEKETWQGKLLSSNWETPVVFTTMVQFLETLFGSGTGSARRMHNLANAVLVFDESRVPGLVELPFYIREGCRQIIRVGRRKSRTKTVEAVPVDVALGSFRVDVLTVGKVETPVIVFWVIGAVGSGSSVVSC